jgi:hypothetical protein
MIVNRGNERGLARWRKTTRKAAVTFAVASLALVGGGAAHAQTQPPQCPAIPNTLLIQMSGTITYVDGSTEPVTGSLTAARDQSNSCGRGTGSIATGCTFGRTTLARLITNKVLQIVDKNAKVFDLACGILKGTLTLGEPPLASAAGSFDLRLTQVGATGGTGVVAARVDMFVPGDAASVSQFLGNLTSFENIIPDGAGKAKGAGRVTAQTSTGPSQFGLSTTYDFIGNGTALLSPGVRIDQTIAYDCASGNVLSEVCAANFPLVPASAGGGVVLLVVLLAAVGAALATMRVTARQRARATDTR